MVPILVLLTFASLIAIDWAIRRRAPDRRLAAVSSAASPPGTAAGEMLYHPGHTWAQLRPDGSVEVGADGFALSFAGQPRSVLLPPVGARLAQGAPAWSLVSRRGRWLTLVSPVAGRVVGVNPEVMKDPAILAHPAGGPRWIMRLVPENLVDGVRNLLRGATARTMLDATRSRVTTRLSPAVGVVATDGGDWIPGFGDRLDDEAWLELRVELFPAAEPPGPAR